MNKIYINSYEISIYFEPQTISSFSELYTLVPSVSIKKSSKSPSSKFRRAKIGESITLYLSSQFGALHYTSLISGIKNDFFLLNLPPLNCAGNIFSKSDNLLLGVVLPISLNSEFSIGLSLTFLSKVPFVPDLVFDFPVVQVSSSMSGSGVLLGDGLMVTNAHVIGNSDRCSLNHGKNKGKLMKKGKTIDLALFHTDLKSTPIKKALKFIEGQKIFTVGFAVIDGHSPIVTAGYLTKVVYFQGFPLIAMINAKVFNGQSGGGVFNESFELIGIITANARSQTEGIYSDLAFCILHSTFIDFPSQSEFLFSEESESLKEIFAFQTTKMLPSPRL